MSTTLLLHKFAKKDLIYLYNISYPTLRRWLRRAGLGEFVGRKKFYVHELVLIFQHIGKPRLARTAAQRLKDMYAQVLGLIDDETRYQQAFGEEMPKIKQDQLEAATEEVDHPQVYDLSKSAAKDPRHIWDALARLTSAAIYVRGQKGIKKKIGNVLHTSIPIQRGRKRLRKAS